MIFRRSPLAPVNSAVTRVPSTQHYGNEKGSLKSQEISFQTKGHRPLKTRSIGGETRGGLTLENQSRRRLT